MIQVPSRKAFWGAVLLQLALVNLGAAHKYYQRYSGREVKMRTVPVDPRSLMRGDYVRLRYPMSVVDLPGGLPLAEGSRLEKGSRVWVRLQVDDQGFATPDEVSDRPYPSGLQLQGRVEKKYSSRHELEFGLEAWFVPEGEGRELENRARSSGVTATFSVLGDGRALLVAVE